MIKQLLQWSCLLLFFAQPFQTLANEEKRPFIFSVNVSSGDRSFYLWVRADEEDPDYGEYVIDWGDGTALESYKVDTPVKKIGHIFPIRGKYEITIYGTIPHITFFDIENPDEYSSARKIAEIIQWGDNEWRSMAHMLRGTGDLHITTSDAPNLSKVEDMSSMFIVSYLTGSIDHWDVSKVKNMKSMFRWARLGNSTLKNWDVSSVTAMDSMFYHAFSVPTLDASDWSVGHVESMRSMFQQTSFQGDISNWDVGSVRNMESMFEKISTLEVDLSRWDVGNVTTMERMFFGTNSFNSDLSRWDVANVTTMERMFYGASSFNSDLSQWDVGNVTTMERMFCEANSFDSDLNRWDVSKVMSMREMFSGASQFSGNIADWDVGNVRNMLEMFHNARKFNCDLSQWDVSNVTNMYEIFAYGNLSPLYFDKLVKAWSALDLQRNGYFSSPTFYYCNEESRDYLKKLEKEFRWTVSGRLTKVCTPIVIFDSNGGEPSTYQESYPNARYMVQPPEIVPTKEGRPCLAWTISPDGGTTWDFSKDKVSDAGDTLYAKYDYQIWASALEGGTLSEEHVTVAPNQSKTFNLTLDEGYKLFCWSLDGELQSETSLSYTLENITADHRLQACVGKAEDFIINISISGDNDFRLYIVGDVNGSESGEYTINWGDGTTTSGTTTSEKQKEIAHTYSESGNYYVSVSGRIPQLNFTDASPIDYTNVAKVTEVLNWGDNEWYSMEGMFHMAQNLEKVSPQSPNLSKVKNMSGMFQLATKFKGDLSQWDVSKVTNMKSMFHYAKSFNADLSQWDVSSVTDMRWLFDKAEQFNSDLTNWDVSKVTDMTGVFRLTKEFNGDISQWDVSSVTNMEGMFTGAKSFNGDLSQWDVSNVTDMRSMFYETRAFNGDLSQWDVSSVTNMEGMFFNAKSFNQDISNWDVSNVTNMSWMFYETESFNGDLSQWDVSNVTNMSWMFRSSASFNGDLSNWDVSKVTNMWGMFYNAKSFNQDISAWDVSNVTNMTDMFDQNDVYAPMFFDRLLEAWTKLDLQEGVNFGNPQYYCDALSLGYINQLRADKRWWIGPAYQECSSYTVIFDSRGGNPQNQMEVITNLSGKVSAPTTLPIKDHQVCVGWATSADNGEHLDFQWDFETKVEEDITLYAKYDYQLWASSLLNGSKSLQEQVTVSPNSDYTFQLDLEEGEKVLYWILDGEIRYESALSNTFTIDNVQSDHRVEAVVVDEDDFVFKARSDGWTGEFHITIDAAENGAVESDYIIYWGDGESTKGGSSSREIVSHTYEGKGEKYQIAISGKVPHLSFYSTPSDGYWNNASAVSALLQWGNNEWYRMDSMFMNTTFIEDLSNDAPNLSKVKSMRYMFHKTYFSKTAMLNTSEWDVSKVTDMQGMFRYSSDFSGDLSNWDVGNVTDMSRMFSQANGDIGDLRNWNVSSVTDMKEMFNNATGFDCDLKNWDVSNVTDMTSMFDRAEIFNGDISQWDVGNVRNMERMFRYAQKFNRNLSQWDVSAVQTMNKMFNEAKSFNRDISGWDIASITDMGGMFEGANAYSAENYDRLMEHWYPKMIKKEGIAFGAPPYYCDAETFDKRLQLIILNDWDITNSEQDCKLKVKFNSLGGIPNDFPDQIFRQAIGIAVPGNHPVRNGFESMGWYTSKDGGLTYEGRYYSWRDTINTDTTLYAKYDYQIRLETGDGGVALEDVVLVSPGSDHTFTVQPDEGYIVSYWVVQGEEKWSSKSNSYTIPEISEDMRLEVYFNPKKYRLIGRSHEGGTVSPQNVLLTHGESQTFTFNPEENYKIDDVLIDGKSIGVVSQYTFEEISQDHLVEVIFGLKEFTIEVVQSENGTISPERTTVYAGDTLEFMFVPNRFCELVDVIVDNQSVGPVDKYIFSDINEDHTITAVFERILANETHTSVYFYPNPAKNEILIEGITTPYNIKILDLTGRVILQEEAERKKIDISALGQGVYQVLVNGVVIGQLVKQ